MRIELLPGMTNVVRFPVEYRAEPSVDLLREMAPDVREVFAIAEAFDMEVPPYDLREQVDAETAVYIASHIPPAAPAQERLALLAELEAPVVAKAIAAARQARDASIATAEAQQALLTAQTSGGYWLDPLRERVEQLAERMAMLLIDAHTRAEQAMGVVRAVGLARQGEVWSPRDHDAETDALLAMRRLG